MSGAVIIPGLPNELALDILARLPRLLQARLRLLCRSWNLAMEPLSLNTRRQALGISEVWPFFTNHFMGMDMYKKVFSVIVSPVPQYIFSRDASSTHLPPQIQEIGIPPPPQLQQHRGWFEFWVLSAVGSMVLLAAKAYHKSLDHLQGIYIFDALRMRWIDRVYPNPFDHPGNRFRKAVDAEGGYVYVSSGSRHFDRLDSRRGIWEALPSGHIERHLAGVVVLHGCLYVIGGLNAFPQGHAVHPCYSGEVWDPSTREWTLRPELWPAEVFKGELRARAAVVRGQLFALRGHFGTTQEIMHYQPFSKKWISRGTLPVDVQHDNTCWVEHNLSAEGEELWVFGDGTARLAAKPTAVSQPLVWRVLCSTVQNTFRNYDAVEYNGTLRV